MDKQLISRIEAEWDARREKLAQRMDKALAGLRELRELDRRRREGHRSEELGRSLGSFGGSVFDTRALSTVLGGEGESGGLEADRARRVADWLGELEALRADWPKNLPAPLLADGKSDTAEVLGQAAARIEPMARLFALLRKAEMERRARYRPELHDEFFAAFGPAHLDSGERALCPPIAVELAATEARSSARLVELLSSGLPVKVFRLAPAPGLDGSLDRGELDVELLPLGMQRVYVLQTTREHPAFEGQLRKALGSPRAALLNLLWPQGTEEDFAGICARAVASREFPVLCYDPEGDERFALRFDLEGNPDLDAEWAALELHHREGGEARVTASRITGGEYYAALPGSEGWFRELDPESRQEHIGAWFAMTPADRRVTTPFVQRVREEKLECLKPGRELLVHITQRAQVWETLRELAGLHNPHVERASAELERRYREESEQRIALEQQKLAENLAAQKQQAVEEAMGNLAARLLGLKEGGLSLGAPASAAPPSAQTAAPSMDGASAPAAAEEEPEADADEFWIDSAMCTACDECVTINPEIFEYNKNKQAVIKNPAGGPYKDIVKAAEKCSAKIIHPGKPLNPDEKGLDKLIERAKKFM